MTDSSSQRTPVYIWDYGMTERQRDWVKQASRAEVAAFMLSAPLRIACQGAITKEGEETLLYLPTIHGIPVGQPSRDAQEAFRVGQEQIARYQQNHAAEPVEIDPRALGINGEEMDEYASPGDRERLFFEEALRGFRAIEEGRDPHAEAGLDA